MNRYASGIVKVAFEGPDLSEEALYHLFRVSIMGLVPRPPAHGPLAVREGPSNHPTDPSAGRYPQISTSLLQPPATCDRGAKYNSCPKDPLVCFGRDGPSDVICPTHCGACDPGLHNWASEDFPSRTLLPDRHRHVCGTYTSFYEFVVTFQFFARNQVFDPIRVLMVEGKMNDWFDYKGAHIQRSSRFCALRPSQSSRYTNGFGRTRWTGSRWALCRSLRQHVLQKGYGRRGRRRKRPSGNT